MDAEPTEKPFLVAALYRFASLPGWRELREPLRAFCDDKGIKGTLLLAHEGVNGTLAGTDAAIAALIARIEEIPELQSLEVKFSRASAMPFHRMKVRLKKEIVTMGRNDVDAARGAGAYVDPADWNALITDPETVVIDTRNSYEVALGSFDRAVDPGTASFSEFPHWIDARADAFRGRKVAMFCTGGIRCEKATAYAKSLGFEEVFHLKGGILKYLEEVPAEESLWRGECFVFDERVSVRHRLEEGEATLCRACRKPLTPADRQSPHHVEGVSCRHCRVERSEADRSRYAERHKQVELAERRGARRHIGG